MCRLAGFVGDPRPLSALLFDPPHSLDRQAYAPNLLLDGHVNVDGTGVAWWPPGEPEPLRYITELPPWSDPNLATLAPRFEATTALAAVRSATQGMAHGPGAVQPFLTEGLAGVHNGVIGGFLDGLGRELAGRLPDDLFSNMGTMTDAKVLFLLAVARHREGADLARAIGAAIDETSKTVAARGETATLNLVLADRGRMVAVRHSVGTRANSLFTGGGAGGHLLASEPLDNRLDWAEVPAGHLVELTPGTITLTRLD